MSVAMCASISRPEVRLQPAGMGSEEVGRWRGEEVGRWRGEEVGV